MATKAETLGREGSGSELSRKKAPGKTGHTGRNAILVFSGLGVLATAAYGAHEVYQNVPAVHKLVDQEFLSHIQGDQLVPDKTDTHYIKIKAGRNSPPVALEDLPSLFKEPDNSSHITSPILVPAILKEGQEIQYSSHKVSFIADATTGETKIVEIGKDILYPEHNTQIPVVAYDAEIFILPPTIIEGNTYFTGVLIKWTDIEDYALTISSPTDVRQLLPLDSINTAPPTPVSDKGTLLIGEAKNGSRLEANRPIMTTNGENAVLAYRLRILSKQTKRWEYAPIEFLGAPDGDGQTYFYPKNK